MGQHRDRLGDVERRVRKREARKRSHEEHKGARLATAAVWRARQDVEKERDARRARYLARREEVLAIAEAYRLANPGLYNAAAAKRRAAKRNATPAWVDFDRIAVIYEAAALLSEIMGEPYEVDHVVPLQSKYVCGLHCEANLEIVSRRDNRSKGNSTWPDR